MPSPFICGFRQVIIDILCVTAYLIAIPLAMLGSQYMGDSIKREVLLAIAGGLIGHLIVRRWVLEMEANVRGKGLAGSWRSQLLASPA